MSDERPSKTQRKKQMHDLQALGSELVELNEQQLASVELPERLLDAVKEAQRMTKFEARRRQLQYIGKLMREVDRRWAAALLGAVLILATAIGLTTGSGAAYLRALGRPGLEARYEAARSELETVVVETFMGLPGGDPQAAELQGRRARLGDRPRRHPWKTPLSLRFI